MNPYSDDTLQFDILNYLHDPVFVANINRGVIVSNKAMGIQLKVLGKELSLPRCLFLGLPGQL